jgi:hypothetical protein
MRIAYHFLVVIGLLMSEFDLTLTLTAMGLELPASRSSRLRRFLGNDMEFYLPPHQCLTRELYPPSRVAAMSYNQTRQMGEDKHLDH